MAAILSSPTLPEYTGFRRGKFLFLEMLKETRQLVGSVLYRDKNNRVRFSSEIYEPLQGEAAQALLDEVCEIPIVQQYLLRGFDFLSFGTECWEKQVSLTGLFLGGPGSEVQRVAQYNSLYFLLTDPENKEAAIRYLGQTYGVGPKPRF